MTSTSAPLVERRRRVMSSQRLRVTLGVFIALVVIAISGLTITLVSRVFARLTPALHEDLVGKARLGARNLAQATQYGIVLADPDVIHASLIPFKDPDLVAIVVTDESDHVLAAEGVAVDVPALFGGPPERVQALRPGLVSWSPAIIEARTIGKVAVLVSTARLEEGERLRREMVIATAAGCLAALVLSLYFVAFYLGPVIKVTELAIADLRDLNVTLESRVEQRTSELSDANTQLGASLEAQKEMQQRLVDASRLTGMADVATAVLHNVGNVLNSVNVSVEVATETLVRSKASGLTKIAEMLASERDDLGRFFTNDPRGQKLPEYIAKLAEVVKRDNVMVMDELKSLKGNVDHIKVIVGMQQSHAKAGGAMEPLDLRALLEELLKFNIVTYENIGIEVIRDFAELPLVNVDRHKLFQIVMNLLANARHAVQENRSDGERRIKLRLFEESGNRAAIEVEDNGCGIAPENLQRIFNMGFTTKKDGHGFGLHSSACAAREMGGSLNARSEGLGKGATFSLHLLLSAAATTSSAA